MCAPGAVTALALNAEDTRPGVETLVSPGEKRRMAAETAQRFFRRLRTAEQIRILLRAGGREPTSSHLRKRRDGAHE